MDERRLKEIERKLTRDGDSEGWNLEYTESLDLQPDDVRDIIAEVRRLRGLLDSVRLTVPADAVNENLRRNIQAAVAGSAEPSPEAAQL
jgi:hypothetical protein